MRPIILVVALLLPGLAGASHQSEWCEPRTTEAEVDVEIAGGRYYVDSVPQQDWPITSAIWIYEESNGVPGLQRRDALQDDTCGHPELGDTIIF